MEVVSIDLYLKKKTTHRHTNKLKKNTDVNLSAIRTTIWHRFSKNMYLHTSFKFNVVTASHQVCNILLFRVD